MKRSSKSEQRSDIRKEVRIHKKKPYKNIRTEVRYLKRSPIFQKNSDIGEDVCHQKGSAIREKRSEIRKRSPISEKKSDATVSEKQCGI